MSDDSDKYFLFSARASSDQEPVVIDVITDLRNQGLKDRAILNLLCQSFDGWNGPDDMQVTMRAGNLRRYMEMAVSAALEKRLPELLQTALSGLAIAPAGNGAGAVSTQVQPEIRRLHSFFLTNPDDDTQDDYSQWAD